MSVLIKGMKMPESCESCPFEDFGGCMFRVQMEDCPLIEVPTPHGRLIDADERLEIIECLFKDLNSFENYMYNHGVGDSIATIKNAPTIIEAEEGEGHE